MTNSKLLITFFCFALSIAVNAQVQLNVPLFPKGIENNPISHPEVESYVDSIVSPLSLSHENRVYSFISVPTYDLYPASVVNNKHIAVVICPGGGLVNNWIDKEGTDIALWLSEQGISCMVLKYRTNRRDGNRKYIIDSNEYKGAIYKDARESIVKMKSLADSLDFDADKVGIMGFSAGGWLAQRIAIKYNGQDVTWQPSFVGLIYAGDHHLMLKKIKDYSTMPPFFIAAGQNDKKLKLEKVLKYFTIIISNVKHSELHIYSKAEHGFGLAYNNGYSVGLWKNSFLAWLTDVIE